MVGLRRGAVVANISKNWTADTYIEGTAATYTTLSGTTEEFSDGVDLVTNGYEGAHVVVEVDFDATPTDHVDVFLYGSLDGVTFGNVPLYSTRILNTTDPSRTSIIVDDLAYFRLGFKQTGSTDSHDVRAHYRAWRWQST
jgi:hypothetical protein